MPDLLQLTCLEGPCEGQTHSTTGTLMTVGRTARSKICVKDPSVSEKHAKIEWSGEGWLLQDLDSSNGTKVNGSHLEAGGKFPKKILYFIAHWTIHGLTKFSNTQIFYFANLLCT